MPTTAIMEGQQGSQVFVVSDNTADAPEGESRPHGREIMTIVKEGLNPGELVITSGQLRVSPGAKVTIGSPRNLSRRKHHSPEK